MTPKFKTALYTGSFNPFTRGHLDIATRALALCDRLIIAVGHRKGKTHADMERNAEEIRRVMGAYPQVEVRIYEGLTADFAREAGADFIVRGARTCSDFEDERNMADINRDLCGIETVILTARPELSYYSSSMVRELESYGADVSKYKA